MGFRYRIIWDPSKALNLPLGSAKLIFGEQEKYKKVFLAKSNPGHRDLQTNAEPLSRVYKLTGEVSRDEHGRQDGAFQLPARVELLQAVDRLLAVDHAGHALSLLQGNKENDVK